LDLEFGEMSSFALSPKLTRLASLNLSQNLLTNLVLPAGLTNLTTLDASFNQLRSLALPPPLPKLTSLDLGRNQLISLQLPPGMTNLQELFLQDNHLTNLSLPPNLNALVTLQLANNQITTLALPVDLTSLRNLVLNGNPLTTLVLSEVEAANLAQTVAALRAQGVSIITSALTAQLVQPRRVPGAFQFGITGPPGIYTVSTSSNLVTWNPLATATNALGTVTFTDTTAPLSTRKFYRAVLSTGPQ
jgi:Leucine-rich repeat (LRR) protein